MRRTRNPFSIRRSESIDSIPTFLNLFEPGILDILDVSDWCENVHLIRSARGGGKTSLLRLFTPQVLQNLSVRQKGEERLTELYRSLCDLGAMDANGPRILGVMLMCGRNYTMLEDLDLDEGRKLRLFYGLLNSRILLATLRAALETRHLSYPEGASAVRFEMSGIDDLPPGLSLPCTGEEVLGWSRDLEAGICESLDSFGPLNVSSLPGHDSLFSLALIRPENVTIDGQPIAERVLLMMDDIHKLTSVQRTKLIETVIESRSSIGTWIAERFEALSTSEMLASGAAEGRDYYGTLTIESYWRRKYKTFEKYTMKIAEKRVQNSPVESEDFRSSLSASLDQPAWKSRFDEAVNAIRTRIEDRFGSSQLYSDWIRATEQRNSSPQDIAIDWKSLEILIVRRENKQQEFSLGDPLPVANLEAQLDSSLRDAAELFLAREFKFPYYYGPERIARLASLNIQQFLGLSADLFEDVMSASLLKETSILIPPERQHELMKKAAKRVWEEIPRSIKHGREVQNLIEGIGQYARSYTYRPSAPNDPGVGGSAIRMAERKQLLDERWRSQHPMYARLSAVLASAIAHNLLVPDLDASVKGHKWMVLNLNRLLCVHYDLPLGYGLFKERPLATLCEWIERPFTPTQELF